MAAVMGSNPSAFPDCGDDCPVENVNLHDVRGFLARLSRLSGRRYRLPTEAEWEYACRAGTTTPFSTGANLTTDQANYAGDFPYAGFPGGRRPRADDSGRLVSGQSVGVPRPPRQRLGVGGRPPLPLSPGPGHRPGRHLLRRAAGDPRRQLAFNGDSARCGVRYTHAPEDRGP